MHKKFSIFTLISVVGFFLSAVSVVLTPWSSSFDPYQGSKTISIMSGVLFWLGLILGLVFIILASNLKKNINEKENGRIGFLNIGKNIEAIIAEIVFVISVVLCFLAKTPTVEVLGLFGTLLGFYFHCVFNGTVYRTFKAINRKNFKEGKR